VGDSAQEGDAHAEKRKETRTIDPKRERSRRFERARRVRNVDAVRVAVGVGP
jgi:hypothetical protein